MNSKSTELVDLRVVQEWHFEEIQKAKNVKLNQDFIQLNRQKGKKGGKKGKKESVLKDAIANAKLWETKLEAVEKSRQEYR